MFGNNKQPLPPINWEAVRLSLYEEALRYHKESTEHRVLMALSKAFASGVHPSRREDGQRTGWEGTREYDAIPS
jgi:hypothetical protein